MNYYLKDSSNNYWQLSIDTGGRISTTSVGAGPFPTSTMGAIDSSGQNWQLGVSTAGILSTTAISPTTLTQVILKDSNNAFWVIGVNTIGRITQTLTIIVQCTNIFWQTAIG